MSEQISEPCPACGDVKCFDHALRTMSVSQPDGVVEGAELLPCPFCASNRIVALGGSTFRWVMAECADCGARCGEVRAYDDYTLSNAELVKAWNTRAPTPDSITEKARRVVEMFNEWLVTDFESSLTFDKADALRRIVTTEFGAGDGQGENKS